MRNDAIKNAAPFGTGTGFSSEYEVEVTLYWAAASLLTVCTLLPSSSMNMYLDNGDGVLAHPLTTSMTESPAVTGIDIAVRSATAASDGTMKPVEPSQYPAPSQ